VRLAQGLGYDEYTGLRGVLQGLYRQEITPGEKLGRTLSEVQNDSLFQQIDAPLSATVRLLTSSDRSSPGSPVSVLIQGDFVEVREPVGDYQAPDYIIGPLSELLQIL